MLMIEVDSGDGVIDLEEAKQQLRVVSDDDDERIMAAIAAATQWAEDETHRPIDARQFVVNLERFPAAIVLRGYVSAIDSIKYLDSSGALQTVSTSVYTTTTGTHYTMLDEAPGQAWPDTGEYRNAVQVTYTAGWSAGTLPPTLRQAILLKLSSDYWSDEAFEDRAVAMLRAWKLPVW